MFDDDDDDDDDSMNRIIETRFESLQIIRTRAVSTFQSQLVQTRCKHRLHCNAWCGYPWIQNLSRHSDYSVIPDRTGSTGSWLTVKFPIRGRSRLVESRSRQQRNESSLVLANDPDADRLAVAEKDLETGEWRVFTGNEIGTLLGHYNGVWRDLNPDADPSQVSMLASGILDTFGYDCEKGGFHLNRH